MTARHPNLWQHTSDVGMHQAYFDLKNKLISISR